MYKTYLDLCQRLIEEAGISGTITSVSSQTGEFKRVTEWVKRATTEIEGMWFDWDFLHVFATINLIVGVSDYPAPAGHNVWDNQTAKIPSDAMALAYIQWVRKKRDPTEQVDGDPYLFTILPNQTLRFFDTPIRTADVSIEYWTIPTILEENADESAIPVQFRDIIVWKALQYYANYESADEVKAQALENYAARKDQLESRELPGYQGSATKYTGTQIDVVAGPTTGDYVNDGY